MDDVCCSMVLTFGFCFVDGCGGADVVVLMHLLLSTAIVYGMFMVIRCVTLQ